MSKYNIGDKFVVEIKDIEDGGFYRISGKPEDLTKEETLDALDRLDLEYVNEYFGDIQDEAYAAGMEKAWEVAGKIAGQGPDGLRLDEVSKIFGRSIRCDVFGNYTADRAGALIDEYKNSRIIKVGDIVMTRDDKAVVTAIEDQYYHLVLLRSGRVVTADKGFGYVKNRTGRTMDIHNLLKEAAGTEK